MLIWGAGKLLILRQAQDGDLCAQDGDLLVFRDLNVAAGGMEIPKLRVAVRDHRSQMANAG